MEPKESYFRLKALTIESPIKREKSSIINWIINTG